MGTTVPSRPPTGLREAPPPSHPARRERVGATADLSTLLEEVASGDEHALASVYDATIGCVHSLALQAVGAARAEEVAFETYVELQRSAGRFEVSGRCALSWILQILHAAVISALARTESRAAPGPMRADGATATRSGAGQR